ncbi:hypothetical protein B0J11DRAFT_511952 [Dendryphion nanum]|uniref:Uncharacterized protein n=1 Tax=Dendryphion nanum TaxID=256645 RepID=A0A9P9D496_9PLEO|nr:hypothetical protein B0J11DRAFT_511952 [Dendryphion nanum]
MQMELSHNKNIVSDVVTTKHTDSDGKQVVNGKNYFTDEEVDSFINYLKAETVTSLSDPSTTELATASRKLNQQDSFPSREKVTRLVQFFTTKFKDNDLHVPEQKGAGTRKAVTVEQIAGPVAVDANKPAASLPYPSFSPYQNSFSSFNVAVASEMEYQFGYENLPDVVDEDMARKFDVYMSHQRMGKEVISAEAMGWDPNFLMEDLLRMESHSQDLDAITLAETRSDTDCVGSIANNEQQDGNTDATGDDVDVPGRIDPTLLDLLAKAMKHHEEKESQARANAVAKGKAALAKNPGVKMTAAERRAAARKAKKGNTSTAAEKAVRQPDFVPEGNGSAQASAMLNDMRDMNPDVALAYVCNKIIEAGIHPSELQIFDIKRLFEETGAGDNSSAGSMEVNKFKNIDPSLYVENRSAGTQVKKDVAEGLKVTTLEHDTGAHGQSLVLASRTGPQALSLLPVPAIDPEEAETDIEDAPTIKPAKNPTSTKKGPKKNPKKHGKKNR